MSSPGSPAEARDEVGTELGRVGRRWQQLPLDRALSALPAVSTLVQQVADEVCDARGMPRSAVPDLGPQVVMDQLVVMAYDALQAGLPPGALLERLTALRRGLP